ncbi:MAG: hypothetical protein OXN79_07600 [bacterium]|nr:hypothetical protein [bacterium]
MLVCLLANSWFAATLVFARTVWEQYVGAWWATILAAVATGVLMVLADLADRGMLVRLASPGDDVAMHMEVHFGVFCGQVETTRPVLLRLANGKGAMLWPGYRNVWRLSQQGYAPIEAGARVKFDGESG